MGEVLLIPSLTEGEGGKKLRYFGAKLTFEYLPKI
jgi:hypothetical protein